MQFRRKWFFHFPKTPFIGVSQRGERNYLLNNQSLRLFENGGVFRKHKKDPPPPQHHHLLNEAKQCDRLNDVDLSSNSCFEITTNH